MKGLTRRQIWRELDIRIKNRITETENDYKRAFDYEWDQAKLEAYQEIMNMIDPDKKYVLSTCALDGCNRKFLAGGGGSHQKYCCTSHRVIAYQRKKKSG